VVPPPPRPPPPTTAPSSVPTPNSQPNATKNPAPDSHELQNTLEKLRALVQKQAPTAPANPRAGGAPNGGGTPTSETSALSVEARRAIGDQVRECWTIDNAALGVDKMQVHLQVVTDAAGTAHQATIAPDDQGRLSDPVFRAFAERARRAVLDPRCANLPLPENLRRENQNHVFDFRFSP
jgi:outer membrane biosynthesis protein TonB